MRTDCNSVRREIEESNLDDRLAIEVNEHLSSCDRCRRFHQERHTLRSLMAELETVGAPADFDFRLRARLARERPGNGFGSLLLKAVPITAVALLVLIGVILLAARNRTSSLVNPTTARQQPGPVKDAAATIVPSPTMAATGSASKEISPNGIVAGQGESSRSFPSKPQHIGGPRNIGAQKVSSSPVGNVPRFRTRDSAGTGAQMISPDSFAGLVVVPVDARAFKLSIDNGRGGARTISLPPVTFGSQRLLAREASFVPASAVRSDW